MNNNVFIRNGLFTAIACILFFAAMCTVSILGSLRAVGSYMAIQSMNDLDQTNVEFHSACYVGGTPNAYVFVGKVPWYNLDASGPPQIVFDEQGRLIDKCADIGDCGPTSQTWATAARTKGKKIPFKEAIHQIQGAK